MKPFIPIVFVLAGCAGDKFTPATGGDALAGKQTIERYGCNACHAIPNIGGFGGQVGPPLANIASRAFIAGALPNTPINLVRWILDPHAIEPHTAMPTLGLTEKEARDVAAYLYAMD